MLTLLGAAGLLQRLVQGPWTPNLHVILPVTPFLSTARLLLLKFVVRCSSHFKPAHLVGILRVSELAEDLSVRLEDAR